MSEQVFTEIMTVSVFYISYENWDLFGEVEGKKMTKKFVN